MSHSKKTKRGFSLYIDNWNPSAKKYINTCKICGSKGYSPVILDETFVEDFGGNGSAVAIKKELTKTLQPLNLDNLGRCETCAKIQDKNPSTNIIKIQLPLTKDIIKTLKAGELVYLSGELFTARDAAHKKLVELLDKGLHLPFDLRGATIYYTGAVFRENHVTNSENAQAEKSSPFAGKCNPERGQFFEADMAAISAGPTTSARMDSYAPLFLERGLLGMIGKGGRSGAVVDAIKRHGAVYFAAVGGAGAFYADRIISSETVAFPELGSEAVYKFTVKDFPVIVAIDTSGDSVYN